MKNPEKAYYLGKRRLFDTSDIETFTDRWLFSTNHKYIGSCI